MSSSPGPFADFPTLFEGLTYPTDRDALRLRAESIGAPSAVKEAIQRIQPDVFNSQRELISAIESLL